MATRREARKKNILQVIALTVAVAIVIAAVMVGQRWLRNRPVAPPQEVAITASAGDETTDVYPYQVWHPGQDPEEKEIPTLIVDDDDELKLKIPREIKDHEWTLLKIYDDPAANDQQLFGADESDEVTVPGSVDPAKDGEDRPRLMLIEISSVMVDTDSEGNEVPASTVWSLKTKEDMSALEEQGAAPEDAQKDEAANGDAAKSDAKKN